MNNAVQVYFYQGKEHYYVGEEESPRFVDLFPRGLLSFLRMNETRMRHYAMALEAAAGEARNDCEAGDTALRLALMEPPSICSFFLPVTLNWLAQLDEGHIPIEGAFSEFAREVLELQRQANDLIFHVLDVDGENSEKPISQRMSEYYRDGDPRQLFRFSQPDLRFELCREDFAEVLRPTCLHDLVEWTLRLCVLREIPMRCCKHCSCYFTFTGRSTAEYCELTRDVKGRTCREVGAMSTWEESKKGDELFRLYRREYKRRFVWTKTGRISPEELYAWGARAREKMADCKEGKISREEFLEWLKGE